MALSSEIDRASPTIVMEIRQGDDRAPALLDSWGYSAVHPLSLDSLACMGPEYLQFVRTVLEQRWVDRADNIGKSSGAFCASPYGVHPYILMTWADTMRPS